MGEKRVVESRFLGLTSLTAKRYRIVLADRTRGGVRRFTLPLRRTIAASLCVLAVPVLMGLGARWSARSAMGALQLENTALRMEVTSYREATGELAAQIASLQSEVDDIGVRAEVDPASNAAVDRLPERVRARAMGGGAIAAPVLSGIFGSPDNSFGVLRDLLGVLEERLNTVRTGVERRQALASATPSIWPIAGWISSGYGNRRDPFNGSSDFHPGLDISGHHGQPIQAPADGVVETAALSGDYGNLVTINHGFGLATRYGHLSRFAVTPGQQVQRGQVIGYVGSTGRSTSAHLHYEILVNGQLTNPLNLLAGK
jgi:murein DD-endopeptidase MepM/ murein hydrolase activator NlpD